MPKKLEERNIVQFEGSTEEGAPELAFVLGGKRVGLEGPSSLFEM